MLTMAKPKKTQQRGGTHINIAIDPELRGRVDAWIAEYNAAHEHRATLTSTVEAALRRYIATEKPKRES